MLHQLPVDGLVHERLRTMENETIDDAFQDVGPPEASDDSPPSAPNPVYSMGFVPNVQQGQTEEEILCQAALQNDGPVIMTMPSVHGTPISEYAGLQIAIDTFPTLFPTGEADYNANRDHTVDMKEWAAHLLCLKGGRFARHPRFRNWVLNTIMHQTAKGASNWYLNTHKVTIHKSQGMTLEKVVVELGPSDFTPGLLFVAISWVKTLDGLAFRSRFEAARLQKVRETDSMQMLKDDNEWHSQLGFQLNTYGMDLSEYVFFD